MLKLFLCWRYLLKRRMALAGVVAVGLCVAFLIVATSLFTGFINAFDYHLEQAWGEVTLESPLPITDVTQLEVMLEESPVVGRAMATAENGALLYLGRGDVRAVQVMGVSLDKIAQGKAFQDGLLIQANEREQWALTPGQQAAARKALAAKLGRQPREEEMPVPIIVGIGLLAEPDEMTDAYPVEQIRKRIAEQDEPMVLTMGQGGRDAEGARPVHLSGWCIDVVQTGWHMADSQQIYVPLTAMQDRTGIDTGGGRRALYPTVRIYGAAGQTSAEVVSAAQAGWERFARDVLGQPGVQADIHVPLEHPDLQRFTAEIRKQMRIIQIILGFVGLVASLLIFVILYMIVTQKRRDIGIVRSLGGAKSDLAGLYLSFGLIIGVLGSVLGIILGGYLTRHIADVENLLTQLFGLKIWKSGVYMFSEIPNTVAWGSVWWIALLGVAFATIGALAPAIRAARLQPAATLRFE